MGYWVETIVPQTAADYGYMAAGSRVWVRAWAAAYAERRSLSMAQSVDAVLFGGAQ